MNLRTPRITGILEPIPKRTGTSGFSGRGAFLRQFWDRFLEPIPELSAADEFRGRGRLLRRLGDRFFLLVLLGSAVSAAGQGVIDTANSPHVKVRAVDHAAVRWTEGFWAERFDLCRRVIVPSMDEVMRNPEIRPTSTTSRSPPASARAKFFGNFWSDGDCYKWIEAAASVYNVTREAGTRPPDGRADRRDRQGPGARRLHLHADPAYRRRKRWEDLKYHELYNMGHLLTAACIHHRATGKDNFLHVARKLGDYLYAPFRAAAQGIGPFLLQSLEHHGRGRAVPHDRRGQVPEAGRDLRRHARLAARRHRPEPGDGAPARGDRRRWATP